MKKLVGFLMICLSWGCTSENSSPEKDFTTVFEASEGQETATYEQVIQFYTDLALAYADISIEAIGETDSGEPLHMVSLNPDGTFDFPEIRKNKRILLINNGIHPGESDGIDATMMLFRDIAKGSIKMPENTVLVTIPVYNVGGSMNRNSGTRANQNGPQSYGFRGNARNYDLNRDFIKSDTKNARTFAKIFHKVQPDVFIDNHVSNGADYQYVLTHLFTQHNKLGGALGDYMHQVMMPSLERKLADKDWDITPYVNVFNRTPEQGFSQFLDSPRYSTGYTTLFNTLGMMVETHMLKPYNSRVEGTYELMKSMIEITEMNGDDISRFRKKQLNDLYEQDRYAINWTVDTTRYSILDFKGYEGTMVESEVTGAMRLEYDRTRPFTKKVPYQNYFIPAESVSIPKAYVIPQGWHDIVELLQLNDIEMNRFKSDTSMTVESYRIASFDTRNSAYEGHYQHYNTVVTGTTQDILFNKGDYLIYTRQPGIRYLLETLEPVGPDSFFNWNFFDTILQQKEGFSPYVFEDTAKALLENDPDLKADFELKKTNEADFSANWFAQLDWLYKQSNHYEKAHMQYPVYRLK